jgi:outer membrane protein OmpA-like peptidoglycan-associated protein
MIKNIDKTKLLLLPLLLTFGCSQKAIDTPRLIKAQGSYLEIKQNPTIAKEAPMELMKAGKLYKLSNELKKADDIQHVTYLLENQVKIAKDWAKTKLMRNKIDSLNHGKTEALLVEKNSKIKTLQREIDEVKQEKIQPLETPEELETEKESLVSIEDLQATENDNGYLLSFRCDEEKQTTLPNSLPLIDKLAKFLVQNPDRFVLIEAHTDKEEGSRTSNLDLSLRRAIALQEALIEKGVDMKRFFIKGYGEAYPFGSAEQNRRIEVLILKEGVDPRSAMRDR